MLVFLIVFLTIYDRKATSSPTCCRLWVGQRFPDQERTGLGVIIGVCKGELNLEDSSNAGRNESTSFGIFIALSASGDFFRICGMANVSFRCTMREQPQTFGQQVSFNAIFGFRGTMPPERSMRMTRAGSPNQARGRKQRARCCRSDHSVVWYVSCAQQNILAKARNVIIVVFWFEEVQNPSSGCPLSLAEASWALRNKYKLVNTSNDAHTKVMASMFPCTKVTRPGIQSRLF